MLNTTTRRCPACGVMLRQQNGNTGVCPQCYRKFCYKSEAFSGRTPAASACDGSREIKIFFLVIAIFLSFLTGLLPITIMLVCGLVRLCKEADNGAAVSNPQGRVVPTGTYLQKRSDYIRVFRTMNFVTMPLGVYGERALHQLERLEQKQEAVTQLDLDTPQTAPCLDVLAETLHGVRTQGGALPDDFDNLFSRQMMMHG